MITTFFGAHSFGGDAAYVDRLSQALCRRGHEVHVYYCVDAFNAVRGDHPLRAYTPPPGLHLHPLKSRFGILSPLATQATGLPFSSRPRSAEALDDPDTDVVHFHNISLVGGPGVLGLGANRRAVRIMTAHEHWLICPMHLLWKYDRKLCDGAELRELLPEGAPAAPGLAADAGDRAGAAQPRRAGLPQPPRPGRASPPRPRRASCRWSTCPISCPTAGREGSSDEPPRVLDRPYLAAAGRLVKMKGFQRLIPLMRYLPEVDLRIAGTGPYEPELRALAGDLPNVHFEGLLGGAGAGPAVPQRPRGRGAVAVPRDVRLRRARGVRGGHAGRRPRRRRRPLRDRAS